MGSHHSEQLLLKTADAYEAAANHGFLKPSI
jgi:hypothetical protein